MMENADLFTNVLKARTKKNNPRYCHHSNKYFDISSLSFWPLNFSSLKKYWKLEPQKMFLQYHGTQQTGTKRLGSKGKAWRYVNHRDATSFHSPNICINRFFIIKSLPCKCRNVNSNLLTGPLEQNETINNKNKMQSIARIKYWYIHIQYTHQITEWTLCDIFVK
jgi:hypothetical protein